MEISGESLPIGIIQEIETDCFQIDCQDQDCFVMSSDGVENKCSISGSAAAIRIRFCSGLKPVCRRWRETGCADDVTVLIARVSKR